MKLNKSFELRNREVEMWETNSSKCKMHSHCLASVTSTRLLHGYLILTAQSTRASCQIQSCLNNLGLTFFNYLDSKLLYGTHSVLVLRHHCLCNHHVEEPSALSWSTQEKVKRSLPHGMQAGTHSHSLIHSHWLIHSPLPRLDPASFSLAAEVDHKAHKGKPDLPWFPPQCAKAKHRIHWFSSINQAALPGMAVPALTASESQPLAAPSCEEDTE